MFLHSGYQRTHNLPSEFVLYIDDKFNDAETLGILFAAEAWEKATHGRIKFKLKIHKVKDFTTFNVIEKVEDEFVIWRLSNDSPELFMFEIFEVGHSIVGYGKPGKNIILVPERIQSYHHWLSVVSHELGHHIGLKHTPSVMSHMPQERCITKYDLEQFCELYECNREWHTQKTCLWIENN